MDTTSIITAIITVVGSGLFSLFGSMIAGSKNQAVTDTKIEELTREVREHNGFAHRVPLLEQEVKHINEKLTALETKIDIVDRK